MEVGFFDTVHDIKQKLQSRRGWPAAAVSLFHNGDALADAGGGRRRRRCRAVRHRGGLRHPRRARRRRRRQAAAAAAERTQGQEQEAGRRRRRGGGARERGVAVRAGRAEVAVGARRAVAALRRELEERAFPLPRDGAYFFIHRQSVMDESRSFEWHGVAAGDEVVVFEGSVTRPPTY